MKFSSLSIRCMSPRTILGGAVLFLTACSFSRGRTSSAANTSSEEVAVSKTSWAPRDDGLSKPCSLVTQAEVETALGKGATMTSDGTQKCLLRRAGADATEQFTIVVLAAEHWKEVKENFLQAGMKDVPGLGDDAFGTCRAPSRATGPVSLCVYNVRKGSKYVQVFTWQDFTQHNIPANDKVTRYLAERAASRL